MRRDRRFLRALALLLCVITALGCAVPGLAVAATAVKLDRSTLSLDLGRTSSVKLKATVTPAGADEALQWVTSNKAVATVSQDGTVTAVGKGTCVIGARGAGTSWAKCRVTVTGSASPSKPAARLGKSSATVGAGSTLQLSWAVTPSSLASSAEWVSSNTAVATVSSTGLVTGVKAGSCVIGLRVPGSSWAKCKLTVTKAAGPAPTAAPTAAPVSGSGTVTLGATSAKMDLGSKSVAKLRFTVSPASAASSVEWVTTNAAVATVENGVITARGGGSCVIGARVPGGKWAKCKVTVSATGGPTALSLEKTAVSVAPGGRVKIAATTKPAGAALVWTSADTSVARVDAAGNVTGVSAGTTTVRVQCSANVSLAKTVQVTVTENAVTAVVPAQTIYTVAQGGSVRLEASAEPASASQKFTYVSSDTSVATVSANGVVTGKKAGKAVVRIYSAEDSGVWAAVGVKVAGQAPTSISFSTTELYFAPGDATTLKPTLLPAGCTTGLTWASSAPSVVSVDGGGRVIAMKTGSAVVTATTTAGSLSASVRITVLSTDYTTVIPARWSLPADLKVNLAKIDAIRESALNAVTAAVNGGLITAAEGSQRRTIITRAFAMYRFPWTTSVDQPYWRASASVNGLKDYKAGRVYYGLPYIQCGKTGDFTARRFNELNAVSGGYYVASASGIYKMSQTKKYDGMYAGNDCSTFVSLAQWGLGNAHSYDYTDLMRTTTVYRTVNEPRNMRPGDILVKSGHCVLFLYYVDDARTQMMIIEQGGGNSADIHNTVTCSVVNVTSYTAGGYIIRRKASFAG